jgi:hypothetical protein
MRKSVPIVETYIWSYRANIEPKHDSKQRIVRENRLKSEAAAKQFPHDIIRSGGVHLLAP